MLMMREEMKWAQKARNKGIVLGERNTRYFQTVVKQRRARNRIYTLRPLMAVSWRIYWLLNKLF